MVKTLCIGGPVMEILKEVDFHGVVLRVVRGDLTESAVDAVVNAANSYLRHGGGVAGAIVRKGGSIIQEESDRIGFVPVGSAALTTGGRLKARHVIHAVGPMWGEGDEEMKLKRAVRSVLALAAREGFASISMPAISAGIFGVPKKRCAGIIVGETAEFLKEGPTSLKSISFYLMDAGIIDFFLEDLGLLEGR
jgi:O-acetyl-ADP-ribose deacetylase (regulator of RNase III)